MNLITVCFNYCYQYKGDGRIVLDDSILGEEAPNGCDGIPAKKFKKQFPVDLPLDIVLGRMPQKVGICIVSDVWTSVAISRH